MYLVLVLLWIIFNGRFTVEILLFGMGISALIYWFMCRFLDFGPAKDILMFKELFLFIGYLFVLIREILKANREALGLLMGNRYEIEPVIVHFKTSLRTDTAKILLANSITLTPGTVTVSLEGDEFYVHCLDRSLAAGLSDSAFVDILKKMETLREKYRPQRGGNDSDAEKKPASDIIMGLEEDEKKPVLDIIRDAEEEEGKA